MKQAEAIKQAQRQADKTGQTVFIVWEPPEFEDEGHGNGYNWATGFDLATYFQGLEPLRAILPRGKQARV